MKRTEWLLLPIQLFGYWLNQTNRRDDRLKTCTYLLQASTDVHLHHFQISSLSFISKRFQSPFLKEFKTAFSAKNYWVEQLGSFNNDMNEMIKIMLNIIERFQLILTYINKVSLRSLICVPYWKFSFWKEKTLPFLIETLRNSIQIKH